MTDAAIETRLREVERWQSEHGGSCQVRNLNQDAINKDLYRRVVALEWKVAWFSGVAAAIGAAAGAYLQKLF